METEVMLLPGENRLPLLPVPGIRAPHRQQKMIR